METSEPSPAAPEGAPSPMVDQAMAGGAASAGKPFTMELDPEGQDRMGVLLILDEGERPKIEILDAEGIDSSATVTWADGGGPMSVPMAEVLLEGLAGERRTLRVTSKAAFNFGVQTRVTTPARLETSFKPSPDKGIATVSVTVVGATKKDLADLSVTADFDDGKGKEEKAKLLWDEAAGDFRAEMPLPSGQYMQVMIRASGPNLHRYELAGAVLPDGSGTIGTVHGDSVSTTGGDGTGKALSLPIAVEVDRADTYTLVLDVVDAQGARVNARVTADLKAGLGLMTVNVPLSSLKSAGVRGPLSLVNGSLKGSWPEDETVATSDDMGTSSAYDG